MTLQTHADLDVVDMRNHHPTGNIGEILRRIKCEFYDAGFDASVSTLEHSVLHCAYVWLDVPFSVMLPATRFFSWMWCVDDVFDNNIAFETKEKAVKKLIDILYFRKVTSSIWYGRVLIKLARDLYQMATEADAEEAYYRFVDACKNSWERGTLVFYRYKECPTPKEYLKLRRYDGCMKVVSVMIEIITASALSEKTRSDDRMRELRDMWTDHVSYTNDIFSYSCEMKDNKLSLNCVASILEHTACSLPEAIDEVVSKSNQCVARFEELARDLILKPPCQHELPRIKSYIVMARNWMRGSIIASRLSKRYSVCD